MKKILFSTLVLAGMFANAQTAEENKVERPNIVKSNVTAYAFRNFSLNYERILNKRFSVGISGSTLAKGKIPYISSFNIDKDFESAQLMGTQFTFEPRFYVGRGYGEGFYIAPYYRYSSFRVSDINYTFDYNNVKTPVEFSGSAKAHSGGVMFGAQWFLGKRNNIVLDAWFIGAHYGLSQGQIKGETSRTLTLGEQAELKKQIEDKSIPMLKYTTTVDKNSATINIDGPWAGLRAGLSLGYRF